MEAELTRLTHKTATQLHLVAESCTICSSRSKRPVRKLLDTSSYKTPMDIPLQKSDGNTDTEMCERKFQTLRIPRLHDSSLG
jgi:hypothetical protein